MCAPAAPVLVGVYGFKKVKQALTPNIPKVSPSVAAPPPPTNQEIVDKTMQDARYNERKKRLRAAGLQSTVLTSMSGLNSAPTTRKTLLGQ